ncbi:MAG: methyltransferase [Tannerella sp.]|jgi:tRNA1Val (adenine37-N6)-methyltransferase|nr:methyltransferase [Tannerella sp.]
MPNSYFQFKQFTVWHDRCAMKVGTDSVLLGAWSSVDKPFSVLDIGTGTGLIALMIAQRSQDAAIDAIDIDREACVQATENIERSSFKDRIRIFHRSFQEYTTEKKYSLILSNPPYFSDSMKSPDKKRNTARHNDSLPLKQLIEHAITMLSDDGKIALVLPVSSSGEIDFILATHRLHTVRRTEVVSIEGLKPKRFLIELSGKAPPGYTPLMDRLVLTTHEHKRTPQYNSLTKDFYL